MTLGELADMLETSARSLVPRLENDLVEIGAVVRTTAAEYIGHEMPEWPPLAPSTIKQKERLGYTGRVSGTDPLLRTGEMRDSIKAVVADLTLAVGSTDKVAVFQELGTSRMPPRPFLGLAMSNSLEFAAERLGETAAALLTPGADFLK